MSNSDVSDSAFIHFHKMNPFICLSMSLQIFLQFLDILSYLWRVIYPKRGSQHKAQLDNLVSKNPVNCTFIFDNQYNLSEYLHIHW